jgi:hypothetical protein
MAIVIFWIDLDMVQMMFKVLRFHKFEGDILYNPQNQSPLPALLLPEPSLLSIDNMT